MAGAYVGIWNSACIHTFATLPPFARAIYVSVWCMQEKKKKRRRKRKEQKRRKKKPPRPDFTSARTSVKVSVDRACRVVKTRVELATRIEYVRRVGPHVRSQSARIHVRSLLPTVTATSSRPVPQRLLSCSYGRVRHRQVRRDMQLEIYIHRHRGFSQQGASSAAAHKSTSHLQSRTAKT